MVHKCKNRRKVLLWIKQQNNQPQDGENGSNGKFPKNQFYIVLIAVFITFAIAAFMRSYMIDKSQKEITYDEFVSQLENGDIEAVTIRNTQIDIQYKEDSGEYNPILKTYTVPVERDYKLTDRLLAGGVEIRRERQDSMAMIEYSAQFYPSVCIDCCHDEFHDDRRSGVVWEKALPRCTCRKRPASHSKMWPVRTRQRNPWSNWWISCIIRENIPISVQSFRRVPCLWALRELVRPCLQRQWQEKHRCRFSLCPVRTLWKCSWVWVRPVSATCLRRRQQNAPCIIFIDEIDAIGRSRSGGTGRRNDRSSEQTLNQLLSEMDGLDTSKGLLILAATNRPEVLDPALLRPGRFDRRVIVDRPDLKGRVDILKVHAKNVSLDETVDLQAIALATAGAVGSDLANMINEAAILAVKNGRNAVSQKDLFEAVEVVLVGKEKKDRVLSQEERSIVSYHEVGHALVSALQKDAEPVQKITIVPRTMGALGYVLNVPEEEKYLNSKKELEARIIVFLAGRAAEELVFHSVTTGAANDIEKATGIARAMVTQYGMSDKFGLMGLAARQDQYLSGRTVMDCGEATAAAVDDEVMRILKDSYEEAKRLLAENRDVLDQIAAFLIEKETITGKEFMQIFRRCKGIADPEEETDTETKQDQAEA